MTRRTPSPTDRQNRTQHQFDVGSTPLDQGAPRGPSGWWIGLLALLPIVCCGLPLLFAAGLTGGSGAALGGVTGGVLMLASAADAATTVPRPRTCSGQHTRDPRLRPHSTLTQEQQS